MGKILLISIMITIYIELLARESWNGIKVWITKNTLNFIHSLIVVFSTFMCFIYILPWHHSGYIIVCCLLIILGYANKYKKKYRGDDLAPWDFMIFKESKDVFKFLLKKKTVIELSMGFFLLLMIIGYGILDITYVASSFLFGASLVVVLSTLIMLAPIQYASDYYFKNGCFIGFMTNVRNLFLKNIFKDEINWHEETFKNRQSIINERTQILENEVYLKSIIENRKTIVQRQTLSSHVVFYMNESFFDISQLEAVKFNVNPVRNLKSIQKEAFYGQLISSEFGGGTSNIEFEVLTGLPMAFLPTGMMAFKKISKGNLPSISSYFHELGFKTMGLHSYKSWIYERKNSYYSLGFDDFIDEKAMKNTKKQGQYISDKSLVSNIIYYLNREETEGPKFIYATSMQNYGPYKRGRYDKKTVRIMNRKILKSPPYELNDDEIDNIEVYAQGVYDADQSLGALIEYLKKVQTPTQIMFYGDHLPMLGEDFSIYKKLGLLKSNSYALFSNDEKIFCHRVPFVMWSNQWQDSFNIGDLSGNYLGVKFLELNGYMYNENYQMINSLSYIMPILSNRFNANELLNNTKYNSDVKFIEDIKKVTKSYKKLTYESFTGKSKENPL